MKRLIIHAGTVATVLALLAPAVAMALVPPTIPGGIGGQEITGSGIVNLIQQIVQYVIIVSVVIGVGYFVYGGIRYAMGNDAEGKKILKNAAIGILAILAVGLVVQTIAGFVNRGGQLG